LYKSNLKTKIFIALFILLPFIVLAQDLDKAYIESLPEEVRSQLEDKISDREDKNKPQYRRVPSTMIDKPIDDEDILKRQKRFGDKIFDMMQSSFMPINEPNFDGSYILGFGDMLELQLTGQISSQEELLIKRDGSINVTDIGKIYVSGLSLDAASSLIKNKIKNIFIGTEADISLTNIRDIQVLITGNAYNPGIYTLNGNSNALHALSMAGGIDDNGSYRNIEIIRDNEIIDTLDLYDIFIRGKSNFGPRLRSSDSILVKQKKILVNAVSGVNRINSYELMESENYRDLVFYANGFKSQSDQNNITIERIENNQVVLINVDKDNLSSYKAQNNDTFFVREYKFGKVEILGAVNSPGEYLITDDETLRGIIKRAGGYTKNAYPFAGFLNNVKTKKINEDARERLYEKFIENVLLNTTSAVNENLSLILSQIKDANVSGRVMAEFDINAIDQDNTKDTNLEDGDSIFVPQITQQVYIYGQVNNEGTIRYAPGKSIEYYINNAGGLLESGDSKTIFVVQPNGKTEIRNRNRNSSGLSFLNINERDILIYPGTIVFVPRNTNLSNPTQVASIWAPIISSIALSLTSLSVLNNNN
jgi:protein involved in polysaccharide export with SLBB domain